MSEDRYFVGKNRPGYGKHHIYDREKPDEGSKSDTRRTSLCGMSLSKTTHARSIWANLDWVSCETCLRLFRSRDDE